MPGNLFWYSGAVSSGWLQNSGQGLALSSGAAVQCSGDLWNTGASGGPAFFAAVELVHSQSGFASGAVSALQTIDFYLLPSRDGTNFPDIDTTTPQMPLPHYRGSFVTATSGNKQFRMVIEGIPLQPLRYRPYILNNAAPLTSGWSVFFATYEEGYS